MPTLQGWNRCRSQALRGEPPANTCVYKVKLPSAEVQKRSSESLWGQINLGELEESKGLAEIDPEVFTLDPNPNEILSQLKNSTPTPVTLINTRDCFVHDLHVKETIISLGQSR